MLWFKHDSDANMDAKLQEVLLDYGLEGYGLYWYCIELITSKIDKDNLTFELEHDARIIARNTGSTQQKIEEMMKRFIELGLFDQNNGNIRCLKLLKRLDSSMTNSKQMREFITNAKQRHDVVMTPSAHVMLEEKRREEKRIDKQDSANALVTQVVEIFNNVKDQHLPNWAKCDSITKSRTKMIKDRIKDVEKRIKETDHTVESWFIAFLVTAAGDQFYSGKPKFNGDTGYKWSIDNLLREKNFVQAIERLNDE